MSVLIGYWILFIPRKIPRISYKDMLLISNNSNIGNDLQIIILSLNIGDPLNFGKRKLFFAKSINSRYQTVSINKLSYAVKYGYKYIEITNKSKLFINYFNKYYNNKGLRDASMYREQWNKPLLIKSVFNDPPNDYKQFDYLLWMDYDAAFIDCSVNISRDIISKWPNKDIIASGSNSSLINNGVILFKNSEWSKQFIDKWIFTKISGKFSQFFENSTNGTCKNCGDQSIFESMMTGFDPYKHDYHQLIKLRFRYLPELRGYSWNQVNHSMNKLPRNISKHVQIVPQNMINSFNDTDDEVFIWHCAGSNKITKYNCKIFDKRIKSVSSCPSLSQLSTRE